MSRLLSSITFGPSHTMKRALEEPCSSRDSKRQRASSLRSLSRELQLVDLSEEILLQSLSELDFADLVSVSETSRHLYRLANDEQASIALIYDVFILC